jgi:predicted nucleic acid-binding protein
MTPYADTNLLTRLYLRLPGSGEADWLLDSARSGESVPLPVTWLLQAETVNAFEHSVYLGRQPGHPAVTPQQAAIAHATFRDDLAAQAFLRPVRLSEPLVSRQFEELALRHTARHGFRTYDLLHVASALLLGCDAFWSFDERAVKLARLEGLKVPSRRRG